jgi:hypothetical protein
VLNPLPPFPNPYTPALDAHLARHPGPADQPALPGLMPLLKLFAQSCVCGDLATAVRVLALPLAADRPLHHWLLELDAMTHHHLGLPAETAGFLYQLAPIQQALCADLAAHTTLIHVLGLPSPGAPTPILQHAWRLLGYLYEFRGAPINALACYLKTLPPTDHPPQMLSEFAGGGVLGAFDLRAGPAVITRT